MFRTALLLTALVVSVGPGAIAAADAPSGLLPPRIKPAADLAVDVPAFKPNSPSPFNANTNGPNADVRRFAIAADGRTLVGSDATGLQLETWDLRTGKSRGVFGKFRHAGVVAVTADGTRAVTAESMGHFGSVLSWDLTNERLIKDLDEGANGSAASAGALSPDGRLFCFGRTEQDAKAARMGRNQWRHTLGLWDVATGTETRNFRVEQPAFNPNVGHQILSTSGLAFTPDGRGLAVILKDQVQVWEVASGKPRLTLGRVPFAQNTVMYPPNYGHPPVAFGLSVSPDGKTLAVANRGTIARWDLVTGRELTPVAAGGNVRAVQFAADGKSLFVLTEGWKLRTFATDDPALTWTPPAGKLTPADLDALWTGLTADDPAAEYAARQVLRSDPDRGVAFLKERLTPIANPEPAAVKAMLAKCGSANFNERKKGVAELRAYGDLANFILNQYQQYPELQEFPYELRTRIQYEFNGVNVPPETLRMFRAIQALEQTPGADAGKLLDALAGGATASRVTQRAKEAAEARKAQATPAAAPPADLDTAWKLLRDGTPVEAFAAFRAFDADPAKATAFLKDKLAAAAGIDTPDFGQKVARLIADLESNVFAVRSAAHKDLRALGKEVEKPLRDALEASPDAEARRLIDDLLKALDTQQDNTERLRGSRGIEALERLGTKDARAALADLNAKAVYAWFKEESAAAVARLK